MIKSKKKIAVNKEEWVVTKNTHEPLVSEDIFSKAKINMGRNTKKYEGYERVRKSIFSGIVYCAKCGSALCSCGSVYNTLTGVNTPKVENVCDKCGSSLYKRSDDNEEAFKNRYETYLEKTSPLIDYYKEKGNLFFINSDNKDNMLKEIEVLLHD